MANASGPGHAAVKAADVVVVGGGVIGLSIAYVLGREGLAVTLLDRGPMGAQASWAGAGIISPGADNPTNHPAAQLRTLSARLHAEWSGSLREETGIDNGYRRCGGVDVAFDPDEEHALAASAGRWRDEGIIFERLARIDIPKVEPALSPAVSAAYFLPDRAQIRNPRHVRALIEAAGHRHVQLHPGLAAEGFDVDAHSVRAVLTAAGPIACRWAVVAAGAWTGRLLEGLNLRVATPPVRGQIVLLRPDRPLLRRIVEHGKCYLVPRDDGRILIGSTEELAGFDPSTTPEGTASLLAEAHRLCPVLRDVPVERSWAGLRPGSIDTRPYLGPAPGFDNLLVAAGHQRAGLQLSPGTAEMIADLVLERPPRIDLASYRVDRPPNAGPAEAFRS